MVNYDAFREYVQDNIRDFLPDSFADAEVKLHTVNKMNQGSMEALTVHRKDTNVAPTIYLNAMYNHYAESGNIDLTMTHYANIIADAYQNVDQVVNIKGIEDLTDDHLVFEIVNTDANREKLIDVPHREIMDLSIVYRYRFDSGENIQSVLITNDIMKSKGYDEAQLYDIAYENTEKLLPSTVIPMREVIRQMMNPDLPEDLVEGMLGGPENEQMIVISNASKSNGASAMLYDSVLEKASELLGGDCYIMPSSIHELIAVPAEMDPEELSKMVCDVNETQVSPMDRLSNSVYRYNKENKMVMFAVDNSDKLILGGTKNHEAQMDLEETVGKKMSF